MTGRPSAIDFEAQRAYAPAAECWERAGDPESAAAAYEKGSRPEKAIMLYKALGKLSAAARIAEQLENFAEAAKLYTVDGQWEKGAQCWVRARNDWKPQELSRESLS